MTNDLNREKSIEKRFQLFAGRSNPVLSQRIATALGVDLSGLTLETFANGEIYARYDQTVRGTDVFFVQSVVGKNVNDMFMELLIACDAAKRGSCRTFTAVIPHYGYARQDRKAAPREPITARLVANLLETAGVDRVITLDLHTNMIQGFFDCPVNHMTALPLFASYYRAMDLDPETLCVVSPDVGRAKAAKKLSDMLGCSIAIAHKGRPKHNMAEVTGIIGDIDGKTCIVNDDMIDTGGTLVASIRELKKLGAGDIYVCSTHGIFSGSAVERLQGAPIVECVVTDAVPVDEEVLAAPDTKIKQISVAEEFAECIRRVYDEIPVSAMFGADLNL